ncbi:hypothetical protein ACFTQL_29160 [Peribacillus butanolivorans]|uniref:hypothetical protein n=1 Tax=Peribacillus butanolivorans TaxID=421767 RepID=UPI00363B1CA3
MDNDIKREKILKGPDVKKEYVLQDALDKKEEKHKQQEENVNAAEKKIPYHL